MRTIIIAIIFAALVLPVILGGAHVHYVPPAAAQSSLLVGLILASPIFGLGFLFYRFCRWHMRFHRRMREPRR